MKYYIAEVENLRAYREAYSIEAESLKEARRIATKQQAFDGTVLVIGLEVNEKGWITDPLCVKNHGRWEQVKRAE